MKSLVPFNSKGMQPRSLLDEMFSLGDLIETPFFGGSKRLNANISEEEDKYVVNVEVPGLTDDDIQLSFENNNLSIVAAYKEETKNSIRSGSWSWSYYLPNIQADQIDANLKNGVLMIQLAKEPKAISKKITIKN
jgi:HSP20 family protein